MAYPSPLVGDSDAMTTVRTRIAAVARARPAALLVCGEPGVGKSAVARAVHAAIGDRRPLTMVDCAERDDPATAELTRQAPGPLLLLREVAAAGRATQAVVIAKLAEGVPVLATTAHDLPAMVVAGRFDAALGAALTAVKIDVAPLRDRPEDVVPLVAHFAAAALRRQLRATVEAEPAALDLLRQYPWPRNVHELRNFVDRACALGGSGNPLRLSLIQPWLRAAAIVDDPVAATVEALAGRPLAEVEKRLILSTLQQFRGHRIRTAEALGIGVRTLGIKLKRWRDAGEPVVPATRVVGEFRPEKTVVA